LKEKGFFITGTDTCVGKTTIAAAIALIMKRQGLDVGIMKPFATVSEKYSSKHKSKDVAMLAAVANVRDRYYNLNPFFSSLPTAPYTASLVRKSNKVKVSKAVRLYSKLASAHDLMIVEGVGGILVPLTRRKNLADFVKAINLPVIIVARFQLGMINHILLTLKACLDYNLRVRGIILNDLSSWNGPVKKESIVETIEKVSRVNVLGLVPFIRNLTPKRVAKILESCLSCNRSLLIY
jgi:dethiobiotin synthetase